MKRICKMAMVIALIAMLMGLTSCGGMFTTTTVEWAARDPSVAAAALAERDTADLLVDAENVETPAQAQTIIEALSAKTNQEILDMTSEERQTVLNMSFTASVDMTSLATSFAPMISSFMGGSGDSGDGDSGDGDGGNAPDMNDIISTVLGSFNSVNTNCVEVILNDTMIGDANSAASLPPEVVQDEAMMNSLEQGALSVAASSLSGNNFDQNQLASAFMQIGDDENPPTQAEVADIAASVIPEATAEEQASFASALNMLAALNSNGHSIGSFLMPNMGDDDSDDSDD